jgi:hypothetical protein
MIFLALYVGMLLPKAKGCSFELVGDNLKTADRDRQIPLDSSAAASSSSSAFALIKVLYKDESLHQMLKCFLKRQPLPEQLD